MNVIGRHIKHLLTERGIVAVPGFGMFMVVRQQSHYDDDTKLYVAPSESVSFTYMPASESDDISASLRRASGLSMEEAVAIVVREVAVMNEALSGEGSCFLPEVGRFVVDNDTAEVRFEASVSLLDGSPTRFLPALAITRLAIRKRAEEPVEAAEVQEYRHSMLKNLRRTASGAAAIALFAILAFVASHLPTSNKPEPQTASIGTVTLKTDDPEDAVPQEANKALVIVLNTPADGMSIVEPRQKIEKVAEGSDTKYCLVVASLASKSEAEQFICSSSMPLDLLEKDGRYRVFAIGGATIDEVKNRAEVEGLYEKYPSAWICRK